MSKRRYLYAALAVLAILVIGTIGYYIIGGGRYSVIDCLYMTVITVATIGYGEIIDMSNSPGGRIFTMFLALGGIGTLTYILMSITAFVVEGQMNEAFRRKRMEKAIAKLSGHYIVCGTGVVSGYIVGELRSTGRHFVLVDTDRKRIDTILAGAGEDLFIEGDPTDNAVLIRAGVERAAGVFASTGDDNQDLVVSLTARQLNAHVRVVAGCNELRNSDKIHKVGADAVVSPAYIGGMRMASEMVRPEVVTFLDLMLRRRDENLRVEELAVPAAFHGKPISRLNLKAYPRLLLLAIKTGAEWSYNPSRDHVMQVGDCLIFMATTKERIALEQLFAVGTP